MWEVTGMHKTRAFGDTKTDTKTLHALHAIKNPFSLSDSFPVF